MKRILSIACSALLGIIAFAQPKITWDSTEHNFGAFSEDNGNVSCTFHFTNTGNEPLVIVSARATCGCTTPRYNTRPVAPGDTASISVQFNPIGRAGRFEKKVYVDTNTQPARSTLVLRGVVIGDASTIGQRYPVDMDPMRLRSGAMLIGEVLKGRIKTAFLEGYNNGPDTIHPQVTKHPTYIDFETYPAAVAPGEQFSFTAIVHPDRTPLYGVVDDTLHLVADPTLFPTSFELPVVTIINEDFSQLTPGQRQKAPQVDMPDGERFDYGIFSREQQPMTRTLRLRNSGKSKMHIRRIYGGEAIGAQIQINRTEIKPGQEATITVTLDPRRVTGAMLNERIMLITDDPQHPNTALRLVGEPR